MKSVFTMLSLCLCSFLSGQSFVEICPSATTNGTVVHFETHQDTLFATGFFSQLCGESVSFLSFWDDGAWAAAPVGLSDPGHSLYSLGDSLLIARYEESIDSNWVLVYHDGALTRLGEGVYLTTASGFSELPNIYDIVEFQGDLYACGEFDRVGQQSISGIMRWDGNSWTSVGTGLSGNIQNTAPVMFPHEMVVFEDALYIVGNFRQAGGITVNGIAKWDGNSWSAMGSGFNGTVYGIGSFENQLYVGGSFTSSGSTSLNRLARWNGTDWESPGFGFVPQNSSDFAFVHTVQALDNQLYIAGGLKRIQFDDNTTQNIGGIIAYDGQNIQDFNGGVSGNDIEAVGLLDNNQLLIGGGVFGNGYSGITDLSTSVFEAGNAFAVELFPNPVQDVLNLKFPELISGLDLEIRDALGQLVLRNSFEQVYDIQLSVKHLPQGWYSLVLRKDQQTTVKKWLKP